MTVLQAASIPQMQPALNCLRVRQRLFPQDEVEKIKGCVQRGGVTRKMCVVIGRASGARTYILSGSEKELHCHPCSGRVGGSRPWDTVMSSGHLVTLVQPERLRNREKPQARGHFLFPDLI